MDNALICGILYLSNFDVILFFCYLKPPNKIFLIGFPKEKIVICLGMYCDGHPGYCQTLSVQ